MLTALATLALQVPLALCWSTCRGPVAAAGEHAECLAPCGDVVRSAFEAGRRAAIVEKPEMRLVVTPRVCLAVPGQGCLITVTLVIDKPGADWYCPAVEFRWADGFSSGIQGDCKPYESLSDEERADDVRRSRTMRYGPGEHVISVLVSQGKNRALLTAVSLVR